MKALALWLVFHLTIPAPPILRAPVMPRPVVIRNQVWVIQYPYDTADYYGYTYCPERRMIVVLNQDCIGFRDTTYHEIMHAATDCKLGQRDAHVVIRNLAGAIEQFTRLNPQAARCWTNAG